MWYTYLRTRIAAVLHDEQGDLSAYLAQGILALAALSLTGVVMFAFTGACQKGPDIFTLTRRVLLHLAMGSRESLENWLEFLRDMVRSGLKVPLSITTDALQA